MMVMISLNGINLFYELKGLGNPIIFIHGLGSSSIDWKEQISFFSQKYQTITPDLRGHGQSSKAKGPFSIKLFASDIEGLLKILCNTPVHIIGISLGGMIGLQLAVDKPELVRSLVVVNSLADYRISTPKELFLVFQRVIISHIFGMRKIGKILSKRLFPLPDQKILRTTFVNRWSRNDKQCYLNALHAIIGWDITDQLHKILCPTLIVTADHDYTPTSKKVELTTKIANGELAVIENSYHASPVDQPILFNQIVKKFLYNNP